MGGLLGSVGAQFLSGKGQQEPPAAQDVNHIDPTANVRSPAQGGELDFSDDEEVENQW